MGARIGDGDDEPVVVSTGEPHADANSRFGPVCHPGRDQVVKDSIQMRQSGIDQHPGDSTRGRLVCRDRGLQPTAGAQEWELGVGSQPATAFASASARSVRSQVKFGSSRPKWP